MAVEYISLNKLAFSLVLQSGLRPCHAYISKQGYEAVQKVSLKHSPGLELCLQAESERFCARPFLQSHDDSRGMPARADSSFLADKLNLGPLPPQSSFATAAE